MRKSQQIAQEIQNTVTRTRTGASLSTREVLALSEEYNRLIDQVNKRIQEAVVLLHQGYRSEALQDAESLPPVLEEAAILDLHGAHDWADICQQHDLPHPSRIDLPRASELNNAYFVELRLTPLLVRNRRLALSRAPTETRIQVLKHLAEVDRQNPLWTQDLKLFERTRLREIERDLPAIVRQKNLAQAEKLRQELSGKWLEPIPDAIRRQVEDLYQGLKANDALAALPDLQDEIVQSHATQNAENLRAALNQWSDRAQAARVTQVPPPIAAAQAWLREADHAEHEQRLFLQATMELEAALDRTGSSAQLRTEIERAWAKAQKFDQPLPAVLVTRYQSRKAEIQLDSRRRFVVIAIGTACAILVVAAGVGFTIFMVQEAKETRHWTSILDQAVAEDRLQDVDRLVTQVQQESPRIAASADMAQAITRAQSAVKEDTARAERFEVAMASLEQAGALSVDQATLETAQKIVKRDAERVRFERFLAAVKANQQKELQARDAEFKNTLDAISARFTQIRDDASIAPGDKALAIQAITEELRPLTLRNDVSPGIRGAGDILLSKVSVVLQTIKDGVEQARKRSDTVERLRMLMATPAEYAKALTQFAQDNPTSPLNSDFAKAAALEPAWRSARFWSQNLPSLPAVSDTSGVEAARKKIQDTLGAETVELFKTQLAGIDNYLGKQAKFASDRPWEGKLKRALDTGFVSSVWMVQPKAVAGISGPRYYIPASTKPVEAKNAQGKNVFEFPYVMTPNQASGAESPAGRASILADLYQPPVKSPQFVFAEQCRPLLSERAALSQWEAYHLLWLRAAQQQTGKMDPALQVNLAQLIVPDALVYDLVANSQPLDDMKKAYSTLKVDTSWLDPMDERGQTLRTQVKEQAPPENWPDFKTLAENAQAAGKSLRALAFTTTNRKPVAIAFPQEDGKMGFNGQIKDNQGDLTLEAFYLDAQGQPALRQLGVTKPGGTIELLPGAMDQIPAGTLIYGSPAQVPAIKP